VGIVLAAILLGASVAADFGVSWDETADAAYGRDALRSYSEPTFDWERYGKRKYYGPAHFMFQAALSDVVAPVVDGWGEVETRHFANYLTFLVAVLAFYLLVLPFVRSAVAVVATLLFATQPLYLGHAFINGKDTPFMAFFLLAMAAGVTSALRLPLKKQSQDSSSEDPPSNYGSALQMDWPAAPRLTRAVLILLLAVASVATIDRWLTRSIAYVPARAIVGLAYSDQGPEWLHRYFFRVAENASTATLDAYFPRADQLVDRGLEVAIVSLAAAAAVLVVVKFPRTRSLLRGEASATPPRLWLKTSFLAWLVLAGVAAGLAISIRSVGAFVLLLVTAFYLGIQRARATYPLIAVFLLAAAVAYSTWPFLWGDPLGGLREGYAFLAGNPNRDYVLFMGQVTKGRLLPWFYLPGLMLIQFTEPVFALALAGVAALVRYPNRSQARTLAVVFGLWLLVPTVPLIAQHAWFYDNFRQFLFVTPAIFLLSALGLDWLWRALRLAQRRLLRAVVVIALLAPGVLASVRLHPYQYVYFNSFVGGTRGAFRDFELDYWLTSYTAAVKTLDERLPPGTVVAFAGTGVPDARPDLVLLSYPLETDPSTIPADVIVSTTRANVDYALLRFTCLVENIEVNGAILATIRDPMPCD